MGRKIKSLSAWSRAAKKRDGYRCTLCGATRKKDLEVHHLWSKSMYPQYKYSLKNATTLCRKCHRTGILAYHKFNKYGDPYSYYIWYAGRKLLRVALRAIIPIIAIFSAIIYFIATYNSYFVNLLRG